MPTTSTPRRTGRLTFRFFATNVAIGAIFSLAVLFYSDWLIGTTPLPLLLFLAANTLLLAHSRYAYAFSSEIVFGQIPFFKRPLVSFLAKCYVIPMCWLLGIPVGVLGLFISFKQRVASTP